MAKRILTWNEEKYKRYIKEGRGRGTSKEYKPWVRIQSFLSLGKVLGDS
jgi:hypothetical protein